MNKMRKKSRNNNLRKEDSVGKKQLFSMIIPIKGKIELYDDRTYKVFKNGKKGLVEVEPSSELITDIIIWKPRLSSV